MKRVIKPLQVIEAMSTINPRLCRKIRIQVEVEQRGEGNIPHVHVYHDSTRNPKKCSYIRLDVPEYCKHHSVNILTPELKSQFIQVMTSPWESQIIKTSEGYRPATGFEAAVKIWADTYEDGSLEKFQLDENGDIIQLDYSNL